ncbi:MAG TPA: hypothetical protein VM680_04030 [Verrucomicrobiae bacterium]|nr:hypothetical protein [Verrucomicrobiae bacterium]
MGEYDGYKWIKVRQHKFDPARTWEENYRDLEKHHIEETTFLIEEVRKVAAQKRDDSR